MDDQHTNSMNGKGNISISLPAKQICDSHEKQAKNKDTSKMPDDVDDNHLSQTFFETTDKNVSQSQKLSQFDVEGMPANGGCYDDGDDDEEEDCVNEKEEAVQWLACIKHDFFEQPDFVTVHIYVKNVSNNAVRVFFDEGSFVVKFLTSDANFLRHVCARDCTVFCWRVLTCHSIKSSACGFKVRKMFIEICLRKASPGPWGVLESSCYKRKYTVTKPASSRSPSEISSCSSAVVNPISNGDINVSFHQPTQTSTEKLDDADSVPNETLQSMTANGVQKPTSLVQPLWKCGAGDSVGVTRVGLTGLQNIGNTCYMNSVIQVLANTQELRDYFLSDDCQFERDLNKDNALGMGGEMAEAFRTLVRKLWKGRVDSVSPGHIKKLLSTKFDQFHGYAQQDAQEFLTSLLDVLIEDLNRVIKPQHTQPVLDNGRPDHVVARETWEMFKNRNDSFIEDLFMGQYKSKLVCPECKKVSITFDPFLCLSLPVVKMTCVTVMFIWRDPQRRPVKFTLDVICTTVSFMKKVLMVKTGVRPEDMRAFTVQHGRFRRHLADGEDVTGSPMVDALFVSEVLSERLAGEEVFVMAVIQRRPAVHPQPTKCSFCLRPSSAAGHLKRCAKCLGVGYCNSSCQGNDWVAHKPRCCTGRTLQNMESVGCPFYISLPRSRCTFGCLTHLMERFARYSVEISQLPATQCDRDTVVFPSVEGLAAESSADNHNNSTAAVRKPGGPAEVVLTSPQGALCCSGNGHRLSGSLNSLGSLSSCSSTATLTADVPDVAMGDDSGRNDGDTGILAELCDIGGGGDDGGRGTEIDGWNGSVTHPSSVSFPVRNRLDTSSSHAEVKYALTNGTRCSSHNETLRPCASIIGHVASGLSPEQSPGPLFFIHPVTAAGTNLTVNQGRLEDKGDILLDMSLCHYLSMDWGGTEKEKTCVVVKSKKMEVDEPENMGGVSGTDCGHVTLYDCLKRFTEVEVLSKEEAWYCPSCKKHQEAFKQLSIWKPPCTLIVQLKRFSYKSFISRSKIYDMVVYPVRGLDISEFMVGQSGRENDPAIYDLCGVVNHHGGLYSGHYTSFAQCSHQSPLLHSEHGWRCFNDQHVTPVTDIRNVVTGAAYLLFYERRKALRPQLVHLPSTSAGVDYMSDSTSGGSDDESSTDMPDDVH